MDWSVISDSCSIIQNQDPQYQIGLQKQQSLYTQKSQMSIQAKEETIALHLRISSTQSIKKHITWMVSEAVNKVVPEAVNGAVTEALNEAEIPEVLNKAVIQAVNMAVPEAVNRAVTQAVNTAISEVMNRNAMSKRESNEKKNSRSQWTQSQVENTQNEHLEGNFSEILMGQRSEDRDNLPSRQQTQFKFDFSSNKKEKCDQNELADNFAKMTDIFRQIQKCTRPLLVINHKLKVQIYENLIQCASLKMSQYWLLEFQKKSQSLMKIKDQNYSFISEPQFQNYISRIKAGYQQFVGSLNNNVFLGEAVKRQIEFVIEQRMMGISYLEELNKQLVSSIDKHNGLIKGGKERGRVTRKIQWNSSQ